MGHALVRRELGVEDRGPDDVGVLAQGLPPCREVAQPEVDRGSAVEQACAGGVTSKRGRQRTDVVTQLLARRRGSCDPARMLFGAEPRTQFLGASLTAAAGGDLGASLHEKHPRWRLQIMCVPTLRPEDAVHHPTTLGEHSIALPFGELRQPLLILSTVFFVNAGILFRSL